MRTQLYLDLKIRFRFAKGIYKKKIVLDFNSWHTIDQAKPFSLQ